MVSASINCDDAYQLMLPFTCCEICNTRTRFDVTALGRKAEAGACSDSCRFACFYAKGFPLLKSMGCLCMELLRLLRPGTWLSLAVWHYLQGWRSSLSFFYGICWLLFQDVLFNADGLLLLTLCHFLSRIIVVDRNRSVRIPFSWLSGRKIPLVHPYSRFWSPRYSLYSHFPGWLLGCWFSFYSRLAMARIWYYFWATGSSFCVWFVL